MVVKKFKGKNLIIGSLLGSLLLSSFPAKAYAEIGSFTVLGVGNYEAINDLQNDDARKFRDVLKTKGWSMDAEFYDSYVWDTDFENYGKYSDMVYFTGHGNTSGHLALYEYASVVDNPRTNYATWTDMYNLSGWDNYESEDLEWLIFAACQVMVRNEWGNVLDKGVHHIFGYRDISLDGPTDTNIIGYFLQNQAFYGYNLITSWKNANQIYNEYDWAVTGHKANENDFVHGVSTGATADVGGTSDIYHWYSGGGFYLAVPAKSTDTPFMGDVRSLKQVKVEKERLDVTSLANGLLKQGYNKELKENMIEMYSDDEATLSAYPSGAIVYSKKKASFEPIGLTKEEARKKAEEFINTSRLEVACLKMHT